MKPLLLIVLLLLSVFSNAQKCETFDREMMRHLPKYIPDTINCVDKEGKRQGYWIHYRVAFNNTPKQHLPMGHYVPNYSFGLYKDNKKTGDWKYEENEYLVYKEKIEHYKYYGDSSVIITEYTWGNKKNDTQSTVIKETSKYIKHKYQSNSDFPTTIQCNKKTKTTLPCFIMYRGEIIKHFPTTELEFQIDNYRHLYERERLLIDREKKAKAKP